MNRIEIIDKVTAKMIEKNDGNWNMNIHEWDWVPGVGLYGLYRAWKYTGNATWLQFMKEWTDTHLEKAYKVKTVNSTAPLLTVLGIYGETQNETYLKVCNDIALWVIHEAPKTKEGGLEHTVTEAGADFSEQIWADTLFMVCIFLAKLGKLTGNKDFTEEACRQLLVHHKVLKDVKTGLFYHGWNCNGKNWMSGALWGRANAWITLSTVEILQYLPASFEGRGHILQSLWDQVNALKRVQRSNGMFGTLLDDIESYGETSATAGIAYGIKKGIRLGVISDEFAEIWQKAEEAVLYNINDAGEVLSVSTGTPVMPSLEAYKTIECCPTLYGQGMALMLLSER